MGNRIIPPPPDISNLPGGAELPFGDLQHAITYLAVTRKVRVIVIFNLFLCLIFIGILLTVALRILYYHVPLRTVLSPADYIIGPLFIFYVLIPRIINTVLYLTEPAKALRTNTQFKLYASFLEHRPSPKAQEQARQLLNWLQSAPIATSPEVVAFSATVDSLGHILTHWRWRALLLKDQVILIKKDMPPLFLEPTEFHITIDPQAAGKRLKAAFRLCDTRLKGIIPRESYEHYLAWRQALAGSEQAAPASGDAQDDVLERTASDARRIPQREG